MAGALVLYRRGLRAKAVICVAIPVAMIVYFSGNGAFGGLGPPRYLAPIMPFALVPVAAALRRWPLASLAAAAVTLFQAVVMTATGPLAAYDGQWLARAVDRQFVATAGSLVGVSGWYAIAPFFLAALVAVVLALASLPPLRLAGADAAAAVVGLGAWAVVALSSYNNCGPNAERRLRSRSGRRRLARGGRDRRRGAFLARADRAAGSAMSLDTETGRDRYFAARERELAAARSRDGAASPSASRSASTARSAARPARRAVRQARLPDRPLRGVRARLLEPAGRRELVLEEYRRGRRERPLDRRAHVAAPARAGPREVRRDPRRARAAPRRGAAARRRHVDRPLPPPRARARLDGSGTEFGRRALAYARDELGLAVDDTPIEELDGEYDVVSSSPCSSTSTARASSSGTSRRLLRPGGAPLPDRPERRQPRLPRAARARRDLRRPQPPDLLLARDAARRARAQGFDVGRDADARRARSTRCSSGSPTASRTRAAPTRGDALAAAVAGRRAEVERPARGARPRLQAALPGRLKTA